MKMILITLLLASCATDQKSYWEKAAEPSVGEAQSIGSYANGCLGGAVSLPFSSLDGLIVMRPSRKRYYGHPELIDYLVKLGKKTKTKLGVNLLVGDLSMPQGGPMPYGHNSHQIGLDVDIWFDYIQKDREIYYADLENKRASDYVNSKAELNGWLPTHAKILELAAADERVERIFVSASIKRHFCLMPKKEPWHGKIRAWFGHRDHLHVRLSCPKNSGECQPQAVVADDGCGEELEWWFSDEAKELVSAPAEKKERVLPIACQQISK